MFSLVWQLQLIDCSLIWEQIMVRPIYVCIKGHRNDCQIYFFKRYPWFSCIQMEANTAFPEEIGTAHQYLSNLSQVKNFNWLSNLLNLLSWNIQIIWDWGMKKNYAKIGLNMIIMNVKEISSNMLCTLLIVLRSIARIWTILGIAQYLK